MEAACDHAGLDEVDNRPPLPPSPLNGVVLPRSNWRPGVSGNPLGRPRLQRPPSAALAELNAVEGGDPEECIANFKLKRGKRLCAADFKAIAMFRAESDADRRTHVAAFEASTDRLEGKVTQTHVIETDVRGFAQRLAEELGVSADEVVALAARLGESSSAAKPVALLPAAEVEEP